MSTRTVRIGRITNLPEAELAIRDLERSLSMVARDDLAFVEVVDELPDPSTGPRLVLMDGSIYRNQITEYVNGILAAEIIGDILGDQIADASIETAKFAAGIEPVAIASALPSPVGGPSLVYLTTDGNLYRNDGTAYTAEVAANLIAGQIIAGQIAAGAIGATQIAAGAVTTEKLFAEAVTAAKIAALAIETGHIAANAVTAAKIVAGAITTSHIAAGAVTANEIAADTITASQIAAGAIGATEIAAGAVVTAKLAAGAVTANEIAALTILAGNIAAGQITTAKIAAFAVTAAEIAAGAVTAIKINVATLAEISTNAGIIVSGKLQNAGGTQYLDLNATLAQPFLQHPNISLLANGTATFSGALSAASGTFAGELQAATGTFAGQLSANIVQMSNNGYLRWWPNPLPASLTVLQVLEGALGTSVLELKMTGGVAQFSGSHPIRMDSFRSNEVTPPGGTFNVAGNFTVNGSPVTPGGVTSVFGRTGAVVATTNDYTWAQIGSKPTTVQDAGLTGGAFSAGITAVGSIGSKGALAQLLVENRSNTSQYWSAYVTGGIFRLYWGGVGDKWTVDSSGNTTQTGGIASSGSLSTTAAQHQFNTPYGYIQLGPMNATYAHVYTDRPDFYFNKPIQVLGTLVSLDGHTHTFASLTSKPTTVEGFGITGGTFSGNIVAGVVRGTAAVYTDSTSWLGWASRALMRSPSDGVLALWNNAETSHGYFKAKGLTLSDTGANNGGIYTNLGWTGVAGTGVVFASEAGIKMFINGSGAAPIVSISTGAVFVDATLDADVLRQNGNSVASVVFTSTSPTEGSTSGYAPGTIIIVR